MVRKYKNEITKYIWAIAIQRQINWLNFVPATMAKKMTGDRDDVKPLNWTRDILETQLFAKSIIPMSLLCVLFSKKHSYT